MNAAFLLTKQKICQKSNTFFHFLIAYLQIKCYNENNKKTIFEVD